MKKYKKKPKYIQVIRCQFGLVVWDFPHTSFYPSSFTHEEEDKMLEEVFANGYELICFMNDRPKMAPRYIFKKITK
jgi:hypothetical protein